MRLFIAFSLPRRVQAELVQLQQQVRQYINAPVVAWVAPAALHLTVQFLGETAQHALPDIAKVINALEHDPPYDPEATHLYLTRMGAFPSTRQPRTVWCGIADPDAVLQPLHKHIGDQLHSTGIALSRQPYRPHLTIGRVKRSASVEQQRAIGTAIREITPPQRLRWALGIPAIYISTLTPNGPIYQRLSHESHREQA